MDKAFVVIFTLLVMAGYNGYLFVSSLWNHQAPSLAQVLFSVITVLVVYIAGTSRN